MADAAAERLLDGRSATRDARGNLLRVLGIAFGLAVLVGNSIGMGILRAPGEIAAVLPNAALFMSVWVVGAAYALLGALSVAELGAMHPRSGGLFPLVHHGLGPFAGFTSGWTDWIATCGSAAAVALVLGEYIGPLIPALEGLAAITAATLVVAFALLQWRGIRAGSAVQQVTTLLKAVVLLGLAAAALAADPGAAVVSSAAAPALPSGLGLATAVIVALQSAIFTYDGWAGPVYFGEEVRDPGRDIPRSMIGGVLLVLAIYLALNLAFLRVMPIQDMAGDPFVAASVAERLFGTSGDSVLRVLTVVSLLASINALVLMASRVPLALSRAALFPARFDRVNPGGTPVPALALSTAVALAFIASNAVDRILAILAFFFVANYALTFIALFVLRRTRPDAPRPFRAPVYPWVPGIALAGSLGFVGAAIWGDRANSVIAIALVGVSWPAYRFVRARGKAG